MIKDEDLMRTIMTLSVRPYYRRRSRMKKKVSSILFALVFLVGLGIFIYPTLSNQWNKLHQSKIIESYDEMVVQLDETDFEELWTQAESYNQSITQNTFDGDAFSQEEQNLRGTEYWLALNLSDDGIIGYISIPKINQKLPIYHGTSDSVLQIGVGHLSGTKLPIGGEGTHSVLAGHRGLPSAKLFSDIDQLENGDMFYIHVLDEVLAYKVDLILPMIDKNDYEALTEALQVVEGEDYVTLFTCTPYGVNSHRLLVRGTRVAYEGEEDVAVENPNTMLESVKDYYMLYVVLVVAIALFIAILIMIIKKMVSVRKNKGGRK